MHGVMVLMLAAIVGQPCAAMGDMLRSLGIPTRLVNGYGPGQLDSATNSYIVRGQDAHTWVESYFPGFGWIPFEPTFDGSSTYLSIARGAQGTNLCLRDNGCDVVSTGTTGPGTGIPLPGQRDRGTQQQGPLAGGPSAFGFRMPDAGTLTRIVAVVLALMLLFFAAAARYLRPRSVMAVWERTLVLARFAGAQRLPGETPLELGRRLGHTFPEASGSVRSLADGFVVSAYAPPEVAGTARTAVMEAWTSLRPLLLRRVASRFRRRRA